MILSFSVSLKWQTTTGETIMESLADRIELLLNNLNMSQKDLAQATGITESSVSHYAKGDRIPRGSNLTKIAEALKTSPDFLLGFNATDKRQDDFSKLQVLIARNAATMTKAEKAKIIDLLLSEE